MTTQNCQTLINIECAKLDGREYHKPTDEEVASGSYYQWEPEFCCSYDLTIPAIQKLSGNDRIKWGYKLYEIMKRDGINTELNSYTFNTAIVASPAQMAEALLAVHGIEIK